MTNISLCRFVLMALLLLVATGACTMTANVDKSTPVPTFDPFAVMYAVPTQQFVIPTVTPIPTLTWTPAPTVVNCTPYTAWPAYTVQAGDTLGVIATLTGSTTAQLVSANCLTNPDAIFAGQLLYVPVLPPTALPQPTTTPTVTPNPNMPVFQYPLTANQHWIRADGLAVTYYASVRVTVGMVTNATLVTFYVNDPNSGTAIFIGQDADPWDGAFVDYVFPAAGAYTFQAQAENEVMRITSSPFTVIYDPSYTPPGALQYNALVFTPNRGISDGWVQLQAGNTVTITWPDAPRGATRITFMLTPTGTGMTGQEIGADLNPADGALVTWSVPGGMSARVQAVATMPDGSVLQSQLTSVVAS